MQSLTNVTFLQSTVETSSYYHDCQRRTSMLKNGSQDVKRFVQHTTSSSKSSADALKSLSSAAGVQFNFTNAFATAGQ